MVKSIPVGKNNFALVDDEDYANLSRYKWQYITSKKSNTAYAARDQGSRNSRQRIYMHREITNFTVVDHINGNGLDNRRSNLREATASQNMANTPKRTSRIRRYTSKYKGVSLEKRTGNWVARILVEGKRIHIGTYSNELDAAKAYDIAAFDYHGTFAKTNGAWSHG